MNQHGEEILEYKSLAVLGLQGLTSDDLVKARAALSSCPPEEIQKAAILAAFVAGFEEFDARVQAAIDWVKRA